MVRRTRDPKRMGGFRRYHADRRDLIIEEQETDSDEGYQMRLLPSAQLVELLAQEEDEDWDDVEGEEDEWEEFDEDYDDEDEWDDDLENEEDDLDELDDLGGIGDEEEEDYDDWDEFDEDYDEEEDWDEGEDL